MNQPRLKCLLVDDLEENLLALSVVLQRDDVDILTARSGAEALELLLANDVALALIDVQMPDMDGFELAELMRGSERTRRIPIIFVTAGSREPSRAFKGYNAGAVDFLYKPIDPIILESKADVFFDLYRSRLALAEELRQRSETLRLNEMFTAVLGHDLRNPLNAILTSAFLLQRSSDDKRVRETADGILASGMRMTRLIEDLLDLTRARLAGGIPLSRSATSLAIVVERVVQETRIAHPARALEVSMEGDLRGEWDVDRLQQIASNLVGNAIQHGDPAAPITIRCDGSASEHVVLSVANAGVIPAHVLPSIFDPFHRGAYGRADGLGLGLYIAQQIAEAHHGSIHVDSTPAKGTVFTVHMPRRVAEYVRL
jgi:two-component system sensor histidine kinase/response regulator